MVESVIILRGAEADLLSSYIKYEERGKGDVFSRTIDDKLELLKRFPKLGRVYYKEFHRLVLIEFPYGIFYRIHGNRIVVVAILFLGMEPRKIIDRLK